MLKFKFALQASMWPSGHALTACSQIRPLRLTPSFKRRTKGRGLHHGVSIGSTADRVKRPPDAAYAMEPS